MRAVLVIGYLGVGLVVATQLSAPSHRSQPPPTSVSRELVPARMARGPGRAPRRHRAGNCGLLRQIFHKLDLPAFSLVNYANATGVAAPAVETVRYLSSATAPLNELPSQLVDWRRTEARETLRRCR